MPADLILKNGTVVDGTGAPRRRADVAIRDGKIVVPASARPGTRVIDVEGKVVAPGFVDIHTHYDAQLFWDSNLTCSPWHGVTTVVMGNCGFTLAPCHPRDRDFMMEMFGRVEGMNVAALRKGLDWRWQSFPEYLGRVEEELLGINAATLVGHSAVRRYVMGEASGDRQAGEDEVQRMKGLVREGLTAGAFGFSTSLSPTHYDRDGKPVPSRLASHQEVIELGSTLREFGLGSIEIITRTAVRGPVFDEADQQLMISLALESGRPVNWNDLSQRWERPGIHEVQMAFMERAAGLGAQIYAVSRCQRQDVNINLTVTSAFEREPTWYSVLSEPRKEAVRLIGDPKVREALKGEMHVRDAKAPAWLKLSAAVLMKSKTGRYRNLEGLTVEEIGRRTGKDYLDALLDISADENLETEFANPGTANGDRDAVVKIINSAYALAGISDAGAHTDRLSGSNYSTYLLSRWVRDEQAMALEEAVRRLTSMPASLYGIDDRGTLAEGKAGDVVVLDLDKLKWLPTERFNDFPGGESRLGNRAEGYEQLIVGGQVVFEHGRDTGARPGALLKSASYRRNGISSALQPPLPRSPRRWEGAGVRGSRVPARTVSSPLRVEPQGH